MGSWATVLILWRIWEQESPKLLGKNEVNSYALEKEAYKNKTYIYMTLGFGGFEDPAVIPSMYVVWLQEWQKEKEIPKKGKKKLF